MWDFATTYRRFRAELLESKPVDVGSWHSVPTGGNPLLITMEIPFANWKGLIPLTAKALQDYVNPNLPWAEDHFLERVSGKPLNPAPSHRWWPWSHGQHHDENEQFSHTYPERFWPKMAGSREWTTDLNHGIRYDYGDLGDVVALLKKEPYTRQAVLPVFFPEDTGNTSGVRIPCSIYYHFLYRNEKLYCSYYMRSCDFVRHFKDDVYMAARLTQWVAEQAGMVPGVLHMSIGSLHAMEGDRFKMTEEIKNDKW